MEGRRTPLRKIEKPDRLKAINKTLKALKEAAKVLNSADPFVRGLKHVERKRLFAIWVEMDSFQHELIGRKVVLLESDED